MSGGNETTPSNVSRSTGASPTDDSSAQPRSCPGQRRFSTVASMVDPPWTKSGSDVNTVVNGLVPFTITRRRSWPSSGGRTDTVSVRVAGVCTKSAMTTRDSFTSDSPLTIPWGWYRPSASRTKGK